VASWQPGAAPRLALRSGSLRGGGLACHRRASGRYPAAARSTGRGSVQSVRRLGANLGSDLSTEIAAWLQGVGTVAAVIVALFLEVFLVWWRRPRFDFTVSSDPRDRDITQASRPQDDYHVCWLRGKVHVAEGKRPATNTEVIVQDWRSPGDQDVPFAHGNSLRWANSDAEVVRIASGTWRRVDLLAWMAGISEAGMPVLWISLQQARHYPPRPWYHLTEAGLYELDLVIVADNSITSRWCLSFRYSPRVVESLDDLRESVRDVRLTKSR
jgi:hypothetical protein